MSNVINAKHHSFILLCLLFFTFFQSNALTQIDTIDNTDDTLYIHVDSIESCRIDNFLMEIKIDSMLTFARTLLGVPYHYAGTTPDGFDCSGFTSYVFGHFGIQLSHGSADQINYGIPVEKEHLRSGDLLLFKGRNSRSGRIGHVGIVIESSEEGVFFIHASVYRGITVNSINHPYYINRYVAARRLIY